MSVSHCVFVTRDHSICVVGILIFRVIHGSRVLMYQTSLFKPARKRIESDLPIFISRSMLHVMIPEIWPFSTYQGYHVAISYTGIHYITLLKTIAKHTLYCHKTRGLASVLKLNSGRRIEDDTPLALSVSL